MAKNQKPDTQSSEEEDDVVSSEQESDSEPEQKQFSPTSAAAAKKPQPRSASQPEPFSSSSDEEDSDSESESESDPQEVSNGARKPIFMITSAGVRDVPVKSRNGATKPRSKPVYAVKRPEVEEEEESDGEESKEAVPEIPEKTPTTNSAKKQLRLWSDDDVIAILKGMIDYSAEKKANPVDDVDEFLDFIKNNLHVDATKKQLQDKIRKLKGKYEINKKKERPGRERIFPNPFEQITYELSKSVWGKKDDGNGVVRAFPVKKRARTVEKLSENGEGGEKWSEVEKEEMKTYLRHLEIEAKRIELVIDRLKSGGR